MPPSSTFQKEQIDLRLAPHEMHGPHAVLPGSVGVMARRRGCSCPTPFKALKNPLDANEQPSERINGSILQICIDTSYAEMITA